MRKLIAHFIVWALKPYLGKLFEIDVPFTTIPGPNELVQRRVDYATKNDAGIDVYPHGSLVMSPGEQIAIGTGIRAKLPDWAWAEIKDKSGLASTLLYVSGGVVDPDYPGEYVVLLRNGSDETITLPKDKAVAQVVVQPKVKANLMYVPLEEFERIVMNSPRKGGFGSTGK